MNSEYQRLLLRAAQAAGKIHLKYFRKGNLDLEFKSNRHQLLTKADTESQNVIQKTLTEGMISMGHSPDEIGFIGEEALFKPSKYTFIIDPLDGTTNFSFGIDYFCVSIALYEDARPIAGCIYVPTSDTTYIAEIGQGAIKMEHGEAFDAATPLHIDHTPLSDSLFAISITYKPEEMSRRLKIIEQMQPQVQNVRVFGSTALDFCLLTDNRLQLALSGAYMWDFAAADIIVRESGGATSDWEGHPFKIDTNEYKKRHYLLACHPDNVSSFIHIIRSTE